MRNRKKKTSQKSWTTIKDARCYSIRMISRYQMVRKQNMKNSNFTFECEPLNLFKKTTTAPNEYDKQHCIVSEVIKVLRIIKGPPDFAPLILQKRGSEKFIQIMSNIEINKRTGRLFDRPMVCVTQCKSNEKKVYYREREKEKKQHMPRSIFLFALFIESTVPKCFHAPVKLIFDKMAVIWKATQTNKQIFVIYLTHTPVT